ncbi:hypothetical protein Tco_0387254 [Tanacetum coccineum]
MQVHPEIVVDTIRTLQNSSAARIQITRDAEADPHSANNQDWACDETIIKFLLGLLLQADVAIVRLPDESGFTGMHVAARRKRAELTAIFDRILQMTGSAIERRAVDTGGRLDRLGSYFVLFEVVVVDFEGGCDTKEDVDDECTVGGSGGTGGSVLMVVDVLMTGNRGNGGGSGRDWVKSF